MLSYQGPSGDSGAATLEKVGMTALAAVLSVGLFVVAVTTGLAGKLSDAACAILGGEDCGGEPSSSADDEDYLPPPCMLLETGEQAGYEVKVAFITWGEDYGFIEQTYADGTVKLTAVDGATLGLIKSGDTQAIDLGKLGTEEDAGVEFELSAGLSFGYGDTWTFEDADAAQAMRDDLNEYLAAQVGMQHSPYAVFGYMAAGVEMDPPKDPSITFSTIGGDAGFDVGLGLQSPTGTTNDDGTQEYADPNVGVTLNANAAYEVLVENDADAGTTSYTYTITGTAGGDASLVVGQAGFTASSSGSFKVTRNEDGEIVEVSMVTTREGEASAGLGVESPVPTDVGGSEVGGTAESTDGESTATVTTTTLPVTNDEDRTVVENWLAGNNEQFGTPLSLTYSQAVPTTRDDSDPFQALLFDQGLVSEIVYDNINDVESFGLDIKAGWELGFSVSMGETEAAARDPLYLGAPDPSGTRGMIPDPTCQ